MTQAQGADIKAYYSASEECRGVFMERRGDYGNHLLRHPKYFESAMHVKMDRAVKDIEQGRHMKRDTIVDLVNFGIMWLSLEKKDDDF